MQSFHGHEYCSCVFFMVIHAYCYAGQTAVNLKQKKLRSEFRFWRGAIQLLQTLRHFKTASKPGHPDMWRVDFFQKVREISCSCILVAFYESR